MMLLWIKLKRFFGVGHMRNPKRLCQVTHDDILTDLRNGVKRSEIRVKYNVSKSTISRIANGTHYLSTETTV